MVGIIVKTTVYGTHSWPGVVNIPSLEDVHFLKDEHLHNFHIKCKKITDHEDRDIEIIKFKTDIDYFFQTSYDDPSKGYCVFGRNNQCQF